MAKIRTLSALQDALDRELSWRVKEIGALSISIKGSKKELAEATLIRAGLALVYAHWEGFVKAAASYYLSYVSVQGLRYSELKSCFALLGLKSHLAEVSASGQARGARAALEFILSQMNERSRISSANAIDTQSNLSSSVFDNIAATLDIDIAFYEAKFNFIDESLVQRRNKIAHGEYLDIGAAEWHDLAQTVLGMLRQFKTDIENAASTGAFKIPAKPSAAATPAIPGSSPPSFR